MDGGRGCRLLGGGEWWWSDFIYHRPEPYMSSTGPGLGVGVIKEHIPVIMCTETTEDNEEAEGGEQEGYQDRGDSPV